MRFPVLWSGMDGYRMTERGYTLAGKRRARWTHEGRTSEPLGYLDNKKERYSYKSRNAILVARR